MFEKTRGIEFTHREIVLIAFLIAASVALSSLWMQRVEYTSDPHVFITYWGFPLEAIRVDNDVAISPGRPYNDLGTVIDVQKTFHGLWIGMAANVIAYTAISIALVKLYAWIRGEIEFRRYSKSLTSQKV
jgi:hypothetical protein